VACVFVVDDPTLALIARFVGGPGQLDRIDAEFLYHQIAAIQEYVGRFPSSEREARALEWIEANAAQYRQAWHEQAALEALARTRCPDCPLSEGDDSPCEIHARWLALLRRYVAGELSSHQYVKWSLALLEAHKDHLKVTLARGCARSAHYEAGG
jgi:hypothetical protein